MSSEAGHQEGTGMPKSQWGHEVGDRECLCYGPVLHLAGNGEPLSVSEQG